MVEKAESIIESIRRALKEGNKKAGGTGGGTMPNELLFIVKDALKVLRFLSDFDEPVKVEMHDKFNELYPQPCLKYYGKKCMFDSAPGYRTNTNYVYTVFDYESSSKRILVLRPTLNSAMEDLLEIYEKNGTLKDRDIKIIRALVQGKSKYKAREVQATATPYKEKLKNPWSEEKVFAILKGTIAAVKPKVQIVDEENEENGGGDPDNE